MGLLRTFLSPLLLLCLTAALWPVLADDSPPSRVGRVAAVDGTLSVRQSGVDWGNVGINDPVAAGMSARTAAQGRAELRVGAERIAVAPASELDLARLDADSTQIVLRQGRISVRIAPEDRPRNIEVDLPHAAVWLSMPGDYDISAGDERDPALVAVADGQAHIVSDAVDSTIRAGSALTLGGGNTTTVGLEAVADRNFAAALRPAASGAGGEALRRISAETTGYEALDATGSWQNIAGYGAVWFPNELAEGWAPYRYGHWRWIPPWGWTWIDDMSWGFATSHYGRWANIEETDALDPSMPGPGRWGWVPGARAVDPVYAPALVTFLGTPGVGLSSIDGPAVGWFPLAPGDLYWPGYTGDIATIRRLNAAAVGDGVTIEPGLDGQPPAAIVDRDYANRQFASVVTRTVFLAGRPVAPALITLPERRLENAPVLAGSPQLAPAPAVPHIAVATAAAANRLSVITAPKVVRAVQRLAHLLAPNGLATARSSAVVMRPDHWRAAAGTPSSHTVAAPPARPRLVNAVASRTARPRLHLAAARLRTR